MFSNIPEIDIIGLFFMGLAAILVYGADTLVVRLFKTPKEAVLLHTIVTKLIGFTFGILGILKIFKLI